MLNLTIIIFGVNAASSWYYVCSILVFTKYFYLHSKNLLLCTTNNWDKAIRFVFLCGWIWTVTWVKLIARQNPFNIDPDPMSSFGHLWKDQQWTTGLKVLPDNIDRPFQHGTILLLGWFCMLPWNHTKNTNTAKFTTMKSLKQND